MKSWIYILLFIFISVSCTSRTIYKKPDNLISEDKMVDIWTDLYMATSAKNIKTQHLRKGINYVPAVMEKYGIDSVQFYNSNLYYTSRIDDYEKIFLKVQQRLKELKKEYQPEQQIDSIIEANKNRQNRIDDYK